MRNVTVMILGRHGRAAGDQTFVAEFAKLDGSGWLYTEVVGERRWWPPHRVASVVLPPPTGAADADLGETVLMLAGGAEVGVRRGAMKTGLLALAVRQEAKGPTVYLTPEEARQVRDMLDAYLGALEGS